MRSIFKSQLGQKIVKDQYRAVLDTWPAPKREMVVPTREGDTFVLACGPEDSPALVLLHGSAANSASWVGDVASWSEMFRVFAVDVIGEPGFSAPSRPPLASGAYADWIDDVMAGLRLEKASFVGFSLGGWLAIDYAIRRPDRVEKLVLISPGGIGRNRNILPWALPLLLLGKWGRLKMQERIGGKSFTDPDFTASPIGVMSESIFAHFRPRTELLPVPSSKQLRALPMPVMALLGGKDVFIDAPRARESLEQNVQQLTMRYLPDGLHFIPGQTQAVLDFLWA